MEPLGRQFHVVIDIGGVLSASEVAGEQFFLHEGAIITAKHTHYVFPFVFDFLKLIFKQKDLNVSFYNDNDQEDSELFVTSILEQALGKMWYEKNQDRIAVTSLEKGQMTKDLSIFETFIPLEDTVLIDDQLFRRANGQERNILKVPSFYYDDFAKIGFSADQYDSEGTRKIPCYLYSDKGIPRKIQEKCLHGSCILVEKVTGKYFGFVIRFTDSCGDYVQISTNSSDWKLIIILRRMLYQGEGQVKDPDVLSKIYYRVRYSGRMSGKIAKIWRRGNRMCFVAGVLFSSLDVARSQGEPLVKSLSRWQYIRYKGQREEQPRYDDIARLDYLYTLGLGKLRLVSSNLQFMKPWHYLELIQKDLTVEQIKLLKEAKQNENSRRGYDSICV